MNKYKIWCFYISEIPSDHLILVLFIYKKMVVFALCFVQAMLLLLQFSFWYIYGKLKVKLFLLGVTEYGYMFKGEIL